MEQISSEKSDLQKNKSFTSIARKCKHFTQCAKHPREEKWIYWLNVSLDDDEYLCSDEQANYCYQRYEKIRKQTLERVRNYRAKKYHENFMKEVEEHVKESRKKCNECSYYIYYWRTHLKYHAVYLLETIQYLWRLGILLYFKK